MKYFTPLYTELTKLDNSTSKLKQNTLESP